VGKLFGLTGPIGSGKTEFAKFVLHHAPTSAALFEVSDVIIEVANLLRQQLRQHPHSNLQPHDMYRALVAIANDSEVMQSVPDIGQRLAFSPTIDRHDALYEKLFVYLDQINANHSVLDIAITSSNKADFRPILQWLGNFFVTRVDKHLWLQEIFRHIELTQPAIALVAGVRYPSDAAAIRTHGGQILTLVRPMHSITNAQDPTERDRGLIQPDITIVNSGSLAALEAMATRLLFDNASGNLRQIYRPIR